MSWLTRHIRPVQSTSFALLVASLLVTGTAQADEPARSPTLLARHELWLSLSATLLTAGITGSYALKVAALNDRTAALMPKSTEGPQLAQQVVNARRVAWGFGSAAALFAITSLLVIVFQPGVSQAEPRPVEELAPAIGAGELGVHYQRRF
jgi:hypothetical protein